MKNKFKLSTYDITYIGVTVALITLCSWISIPTTIPFTMQTFAIFISIIILGGYRSTLAVLAYIALGSFGIPVFSKMTGGIGILIGPTGGYLLGFLLTTIIAGIIIHFFPGKIYIEVISLILGLVLCYVFGTVWFINMYGNGMTLKNALGICVIPFIIPDLIKLVIAVMVGRRIRPHLHS